VRAVALLFAAFLAACTHVEIKPPEGALDFSLAGRIAVRSGSEAFTGNIAWRHAQGGDEILLSTPTGQGVAQILRQGDAVLLKTSEGSASGCRSRGWPKPCRASPRRCW
jgi:outer membrane lipoprotein LolB